MSYKYLDLTGLSHFWDKIKAKIPTKTSQLTNDSHLNYSVEKPSGTIDDLAVFTSGKPGITGSISLTKKSSGIGSEIPGGWYNFFFSPHRIGSGGDNMNYGTIILTPMTFSGKSWILRRSSSATTISEVKSIATGDIPTVNNGTLKIQKNGTDVGTFTANQSGNSTVNLTFSRDELSNVASKEYSGIYGSANDQAGASFYYGTIRPTNFYDLWKVRYRIYANVPGQNNYRQYSDVTLYGNQTEVTYKIENKMYSTNNRCYYYHNLARLNATGYNAGHSHILGIGLRSSTNPTSSSYPRTFNIEILETDGCEVTMWNAVKKIADVSEYSTTNYVGISEYDGANNGLRESGDDVNIWQLRYNAGNFIVSTALYRYMLCLQKNETTLIPMNAVNNSTATTKTLTTDSFNPFAQILYYNSTATINANASVGAWNFYDQMTLDLRYSFNTGTTLTAHKDVYLVAVPQSNGLAKLHTSPISQVLPTTANGLIYIYLGRAYSTYQIELHPIHPIYEYKEGSLRKYSQYEDYARSLTPVAIVGSDAANTAGWYKIASSTMSGYGNQNMLYFVKDGYTNGCTGIFELEMRSDNTSIQCWQIKWLTRHINIGEDTIRIVIDGMTWTMYFKRTQNRYGRVYFTELSNRAINGQMPTYKITYYNSDTPEETEPETTIYSQDGSIVLRAQQDAGGNLISSTYATKSQLPTKVSQLTNDSGYTTNTGTVTSVAVKMNNTTKGTVTTSGTIDLGTVITTHQDISGKENTSNKVTSISSSSTNTQYPSALAVYNYINSLNGNEVSY